MLSELIFVAMRRPGTLDDTEEGLQGFNLDIPTEGSLGRGWPGFSICPSHPVIPLLCGLWRRDADL